MTNQGKISFGAAILMSINIMIGAGILYGVAPMTAAGGSMSFIGWLLIGLLLVPVLWGVAQAAKLFPGEGGFYNYCSSGINPLFGFIAHWTYLLGYMATACSLTTVLRNGFANNAGIQVIANYPFVFNIAIVLLYTLLNLIPVSRLSKVQSVCTILKITPILMVIALITVYFDSSFSFEFSQVGNLGMTVSTVLFAYWGFEACCSIGGLLKDGPQKAASVILIGFFITMMLYILFHIGVLYIMGTENLAIHGAIAFPRFLGLTPAWETAIQVGITSAILLSWANSVLGVSLGNITNIHFLARKKLILGSKLLDTVNNSERPVYAALIHGVALLAFLTFITDINILFALTNLGVTTAFILTLAAVFGVHYKQKNYMHLAFTTLGFGSCAALLYYSWIQIPSVLYVLPLVIGIALGVIMFKVQSARAPALQETA